MRCKRCKGLLVHTRCCDESTFYCHEVIMFRCVNCGNLEDKTSLDNKDYLVTSKVA